VEPTALVGFLLYVGYAGEMALPSPSATLQSALLLLGRLDGRLRHSPWADIWLARARLTGAATLAGLAGAPISVTDLQGWIAGRTPPPRAAEGLNDPVSIAAVFHLALQAGEDQKDPLTTATLRLLRTLLDDRTEAALWGKHDLLHFGPAWAAARTLAAAPYPAASLTCIADRVIALRAALEPAPQTAIDVISLDGRALVLPPRQADRSWLVAAQLPVMLRHAGLTLATLPSLILLPRFPSRDVDALTEVLTRSLLAACTAGLKDLDHLEKVGPRVLPTRSTRRSRLPVLARLSLAYPGLGAPAVARLLGVTPQGARKLLATLG
jgi:hypothetical protein